MAGLAGAFALTRYLESMLYEVTALDGLVFAVMSVLLAGIAMGAAVEPAWRASKIDPMTALRES